MIACTPFGVGGSSPADKRRLTIWLQERKAEYFYCQNISKASNSDIYIYPSNSDLAMTINYKKFQGAKIIQMVDGYLSAPEGLIKRLGKGTVKYFSKELSKFVFDYNSLLKKNLKAADLVICASPEQALLLNKLNSKVSVIPDNHSAYFLPRAPIEQMDHVLLVWEGMGHSIFHLSQLESVLSELTRLNINWQLQIYTDLKFKKYANRFINMDAYKLVKRLLPTHFKNITLRQWSPEALLSLANQQAIAVIPIKPNDYLANMKHESKLMFFWQLGLVTIASPIPSYLRVCSSAGIDGNLLLDSASWVLRILELRNPNEFSTIKNLQDEYVLKHHSLEIHLSRWDQVLEQFMQGDFPKTDTPSNKEH